MFHHFAGHHAASGAGHFASQGIMHGAGGGFLSHVMQIAFHSMLYTTLMRIFRQIPLPIMIVLVLVLIFVGYRFAKKNGFSIF